MDRRLVLLFGAGCGLLAVVGCGPRSPVPPPGFPATGTATMHQDVTAGAGASAATAMMGNYGGTVRKTLDSGAILVQPYTFTLAQTPNSTGALVANVTFSSTGPIGTVNFTADIKLTGDPFQNGRDTDGQPFTVYTLDSAMVKPEAQAFMEDPNTPFQLRLLIGLKNYTTFVPTQSQIYFRDCVFAPTSPCMAMPYVSSGNDLGKR